MFGKGEPEPPKPAKAPSPPPVPEPAPAPHPQQSMIDFSSPAPAPTSTSTSTSAILTGINDMPSYDDSNSKLLLNGADYNFAATSENKADTSSGAAAANINDDVNDSDSSKKAAKKKQKKKVVKKKKKAPVDDETAEDDNDGDGGDDGDDGDDDGKGGRHCLQMFYKISWYKPYFDLDTLDFFKRFAWGCVPNIGFFDKVGRGDFYGPFWITTTLLLFLGIASNFASYIAYSQEKRGDEWNYDFYKLSIGAAVFYGYIIVIPIIFYLILRFFNHAGLSLLKCFCAYGYSLAPYIVFTVIIKLFLLFYFVV